MAVILKHIDLYQLIEFHVAGLHLSAIVKLLVLLNIVGYGKLMETYVSYLNFSAFLLSHSCLTLLPEVKYLISLVIFKMSMRQISRIARALFVSLADFTAILIALFQFV